jgi:hypothetical protein
MAVGRGQTELAPNWRTRVFQRPVRVGEGPIGMAAEKCYHAAMNTLLLVIVLLLLFGGGGFYFGGPAFGGGGLGLILLICLIVYLMGGFRTRAD